MRLIHFVVLYTALALGANSASADAALSSLLQGDMKKLVFHAAPKPVADPGFVGENGDTGKFSDYRGKYVLVNFWATWCAPCRKEMPGLNALQAEFGGDAFEVLTIATGRNPPQAIDRFFAEINVTDLPKHRDPKQGLARALAVFGLPISLILDPSGQEIARLRGDATWDSDSARAVIAALIAQQTGN